MGIDNVVVETEKDKLSDLPFPYLIHSNEHRGSIVLIDSIRDLLPAGVLVHWSGIVLLVKSTNSIVNDHVNLVRSKYKSLKIQSVLLGASIILLILLSVLNKFSFPNVLLLSTSICGIVIGYLLVSKDLGNKFVVIEKFCSSDDGRNGCDRILNSEGATIFGAIKLSDAVLAYFIFQLICLLLYLNSRTPGSSILPVLIILSITTIPVILFSIYYQYHVANAWCKLCMLTNSVLVIQVILFIALALQIDTQNKYFDIYTTFLLGLLFLVIGSSLLLVKDKIKENIEFSYSELEAYRVKHSIPVFMHLLLDNNIVQDKTVLEQELYIGNQTAPVVITAAGNLFCNPCRIAHIELGKLVDIYPESLRVNFRFVLSGPQGVYPTPLQYIIKFWQNNIYNKDNQNMHTDQLLHDWYELMDLDLFKISHPVDFTAAPENKQSELLSRSHFAWFRSKNIRNTPTIFINGYRLPNHYEISDLERMMPGIIDYFEQLSTNVTDYSKVLA